MSQREYGEPLPNWEAFIKEIQTREPGAKITVTVERIISGRRSDRRQIGNQEPTFTTMEIEIELGSAEMLRDPISGQIQRTGEVFQRLRVTQDVTVPDDLATRNPARIGRVDRGSLSERARFRGYGRFGHPEGGRRSLKRQSPVC